MKNKQPPQPKLFFVTPIGARIRKIRKAKGLTLAEVAINAGTDTGNLSRIERGLQDVSSKIIGKISLALKCSPELFFLSDTDQDPPFLSKVTVVGEGASLPSSIFFQSSTAAPLQIGSLSTTEAQLVEDFRSLDAEQATEFVLLAKKKADLSRAKRSGEQQRALRYMNDPRVQALLDEIEQKDKK